MSNIKLLYIKDIFEKLNAKKVNLSPAYDHEIQKTEGDLKIKLPAAYKEFLLNMGNGAGNFLCGSDCFLKDNLITLNQKHAKILLKENNLDPKILDNCFVFWMHQGYQMAYFRLDEGDDPKIHFFSEIAPENEKFVVEENLKAFLEIQLKIEGLD